MIGLTDNVTIEIYDRLKHIVDEVYRKKGMTSQEVRMYFNNPKNFKKLTHYMGDLKHIYNEEAKKPLAFDDVVRDILFFKVLMDRIYYEKDNPNDDRNLDNYDGFIGAEEDQT